MAASVVAVALLAVCAVALLALRTSLTDNLDATLSQQALDRAALIDAGTAPDALTDSQQAESLVWIGRPDGTQLAVGREVIPLESPVPDRLDTVEWVELLVEELHVGGYERERMELRIASATTADAQTVVLVGAEADAINGVLVEVARLFGIGIPIVVLLVAVLAWRTAGRALEPVEAIRRRSLAISGSTRSERVPVPETGDEVHALASTMNDMLARLERHHETLRRFTADASHELKSPVANLRSLVDTHDLDDPSWPEVRDRIRGETERLGDLVDNLLFLSMADDPSADSERRTQRVDLDGAVFAEAELLAATGRVVVDLSKVEPVSVRGDQRALGRLIRNLADNAARHADSTVWFTVRMAGDDAVEVEVADDGPGVAVPDRERVFERFTRLDSARARDEGGAGLGLAIVAQIASDHGGTVCFDERPGGGALVRLTLPHS
ncbi:MAG: sensor histidine kinase [Ilumatobacter sp.]